jgi:hypothetical protein
MDTGAITIVNTAAIIATQGTFARQSFASKNQMLAALETHNQGPNDLPQRVQFARRSGMSSEASTTFRALLH